MTTPTDIKDQKEVPFGERAIVVEVRFFAKDIPEKGKYKQKHAWTEGAIRVERNNALGIKQQGDPAIFKSLTHLGATVEECLRKNGITLHTKGKVLQKMPQSKKK